MNTSTIITIAAWAIVGIYVYRVKFIPTFLKWIKNNNQYRR